MAPVSLCGVVLTLGTGTSDDVLEECVLWGDQPSPASGHRGSRGLSLEGAESAAAGRRRRGADGWRAAGAGH